jgi:hypothetical protein
MLLVGNGRWFGFGIGVRIFLLFTLNVLDQAHEFRQAFFILQFLDRLSKAGLKGVWVIRIRCFILGFVDMGVE